MFMDKNRLILGDNIEKLKEIASESVDLIYLDPPFFSDRKYEVIWGDEGEVRSFEDRWAGGIEHYIGWLKERVEEMYRVLKPTGMLFLHCDWNASQYIKVNILDKLFGYNNCRNEIIWKRNFTKKGSQHSMTRLAVNNDTIFMYSKSAKYTFYTPKSKNLDENELLKIYDKIDENDKRFKSEPIELPAIMARKNLIFEYKGYTPKYGWMMVKEKLDELDRQNKIYFTKNGKPRRKNFLDDYEGSEIDNIWTDILPIGQNQSEIIGYPTQKPELLLHRIIEMASNEGDLVLDPFVGGGTTVAVADKLNRKWIGIDQSVMAVKVTDFRLRKQQDIFSQEYELVLRRYDYENIRNMDAFEFEKWIIEQFGGKSNNKKGGDNGIDGKKDNAPIQVKRSDNVGVNVIKNFWASLQQFDKKLFDKNIKEKKTAGYIIAFSFGKGAIEEVARLKSKENIIIELKKVSDIVDYGKPPKVALEANELENNEYLFVANAQSEVGIEFFSWDFTNNEKEGFKADVLLDKDGKQKRKLKAGTHQIAVEAIDKQGLDGQDKVKIKIK